MTAADDTRTAIESALASLAPLALRLRDDSALHAGHTGAQAGGGHYHVEIVAECFAGRTPAARHRLIYAALGDLMGSCIHAMGITARAPGEDGIVHPK